MLPIDFDSTTEIRRPSGTDIFMISETVAGNSRTRAKINPLHKNGVQYSLLFNDETSDDINADLLDSEATSTKTNILEKSATNIINTSGKVSEIRSIYFQADFLSPELKIGINLLEKSQELVAKSIQSFREGKRKDSDEFIMQFKTFIPELFCCRTISESFGAIINSIGTALSNMKGAPLSELQLVALSDILTALLREPAMPFMKAVKYISRFEEADFEVESPGLSSLIHLIELMNNPEIESLNG